jgi:hypothetical protein
MLHHTLLHAAATVWDTPCSPQLTCCGHEALAPQADGNPVQELLASIKQLPSTILLMILVVGLRGVRSEGVTTATCLGTGMLGR